MRLLLLFALYGFSKAYPTDTVRVDPPPSDLFLNASVDNSLNIRIFVKNEQELGPQSRVTGFCIYFTRDASLSAERYQEWRKVELLADEQQYEYVIKGSTHHIRPDTLYRIRATVFKNHVEGEPSNVFQLHTRDAIPKAPAIQSWDVLMNSSVVIQFVPGEDADLVTNYTLEYRDSLADTGSRWNVEQFTSDTSSRVIIHGLHPNRTYNARMFASGQVVSGARSKEITFSTNNTAELPLLVLEPSELSLDPDVSSPVEVRCISEARPVASISWMVNGQSVHLDHSFYTVTSTVDDSHTTSVIRAKSRTRSDELTCVASNGAGETRASMKVLIRGPGSPPSTVTLYRNPPTEKPGYTVKWMPPSHPNGDIKKYVVYHSTNRDEPLSDWTKHDLDGDERRIQLPNNASRTSEYIEKIHTSPSLGTYNQLPLFSSGSDAFYVRVQAASDAGPGIISDVIAIERDTVPISVHLNITEPPNHVGRLLEPSENITVSCTAKGKPRPSLQFALSDHGNASLVEPDVWQPLRWKTEGDFVTSRIEVSLVSSRSLHCRAKNSAGQNISTIHFIVEKPGDAPAGLEILSVDSRDVVVVWQPPPHPNLPITSYDVLLYDSASEDSEPTIYETTTREEIAITRLSLPSDQLKPSHEYLVRVRAKNRAGLGPLSDAVTFTTPNGGPEVSPSSLRVEIDEANTAVLSWNPPNCSTPVESYVIYYTRDLGISNEDFRDWSTLEVPATTTRHKMDYQVGLKPKTFYRVRVAAKNDMAEGPVSGTVEFETPQSMLPIPTDVAASVDEDNTLHVTFPAVREPDDNSKAVESYRLELAESEEVVSATWLVVIPSRSVVDEVSAMAELVVEGSRMTPSSLFWLRVTALLDNPTRLVHPSKPIFIRTGRGKLKTRAEIVEGALIRRDPDLAAMMSLTCRAEGSPAPLLEWSWNGGRVENGTEQWNIDQVLTERHVNSSLWRNGVVESGVALCRATNAEGTAEYTTTIEILGPGSAPVDITAVAYRNQINVTWRQPAVPNGNITKYLVYYCLRGSDDLGDWEKLEVDTTAALVPVAQPMEKHLIRVQAVSTSGAGIISDGIDCVSDAFYEPLQLELSTDELSYGEAEPNQQVKMRCHGRGQPTPILFFSWIDGEETPVEAAEMETDDNTHQFSGWFDRVTVYNRTVVCRASNQYENATAKLEIVVKKPGDAPSKIEWRFEDDGRLWINWRPVRYPNGNESYHIYLSQSDVIVSSPPILWNKASLCDEIPLNVNLTLRISAVNEWAEGEKSLPILVTTPNGGPRDAPSMKTAEWQNGTIFLRWDPPRKPQGEIKNFTIYISKKTEDDEEMEWEQISVPGHRREWILGEESPLEEQRYKIKMDSRNNVNHGPMSEISLVSPFQPILPPPSNVTSSIVNGSLVLTVPAEVEYRTLIVYIYAENKDNHTRARVNLGENRSTVTLRVPEFNAARDATYGIQIAGYVNEKETELTALAKVKEDEPGADEPSRRRLVKEPPLVKRRK